MNSSTDRSLELEGGGIKKDPKQGSAESNNDKSKKQKSNNDQNKQRFIVDRDITDNAIEGIFITI